MCLPAGPLRERISRIKQVDFIVYNQSEDALIASSDNHFEMHYEIADCYSLNNKKRLTVDSFSNQTVHAVAGIGDPERFFSLLKTLGIATIEHAFEDHHQFKLQDLNYKDDYPIIMTEKDAVKCQQFELNNCWYLPIKANIDQFLVQLVGILSVGVFCVSASFLILYALKKTMGLRVSEREEIEGLDKSEHGMNAYPDYRINEH